MKKQVCLIEDDTDIRQLMEYLLTGEDFQVLPFGTGASFRRQLELCPPTLAVLDIMLPDDNGIDICRFLKSSAAFAHIPVLLLSANANYRDSCREFTGIEFMAKPFDIDEFVRTVRRMAA